MIKKIKSIDWKNVLTRAVHTFIQGFLASIFITGFTEEELQATLIGAIAGGLSAIKTLVVELIGDDNNE